MAHRRDDPRRRPRRAHAPAVRHAARSRCSRSGGKPLIVWQIEALARAGFRDIVINAAHLAPQLVDALGDGAALGVRIAWSLEPEPLETAGGIATALPLLPAGPVARSSPATSGRASTTRRCAARADAMARDAAPPRVHLVMVPNPPYPSGRRFRAATAAAHRGATGAPRLTFGNIGVYDTALFARTSARRRSSNCCRCLHDWIAAGLVSGERFDGPWANVGTPDDLGRARRDAAAHDARRATQRRPHEDDRMTMPPTNPLLDFSGLPRFDAIRAEHVTPAVDDAARRRARATVERSRPTRGAADLGQRRRAARRRRSTASTARGARCATSTPSSARRSCATPTTRNLPKIDGVLHRPRAGPAAVRALQGARRARPRSRRSTPAQRRVVDNELRDFRLGGAELPDAQQGALQGVQEELADLSAQFDDNVLDATNAWALYVDDDARARRRSGGRASPRRAPRRRPTARPAGSSRCACRATCR